MQNSHLHIKIKNPETLANTHTLLILGISTVLIVIIAVIGIYYARSLTLAWQAFNDILNEICAEEPWMKPVIKILPLVCIAGLIVGIRERIKINKQHKNKELFSAVDFNQAGVLLTTTSKNQYFFPYADTSFQLIITAHQAIVGKFSQRVDAVSRITMKFTEKGKTKEVSHFPKKPLTCLPRLLDQRHAFSYFELIVEPLTNSLANKESADYIRGLLHDYIHYHILITIHPENSFLILFIAVILIGLSIFAFVILYPILTYSELLHPLCIISILLILLIAVCDILMCYKYIRYKMDMSLLKRLKSTK